jgi:dCMP deaminase
MGERKSPLSEMPVSRGQDWWDHWFLSLAWVISTASKDPSTKVGAVLVGKDNRNIAHGYNGFPRGITDDIRLLDRPRKYQLVIHAEQNALDNALFQIDGSTLYCTMHPCMACAKAIVSRRVKRVVTPPIPSIETGRWTEEIPLASQLLQEAGIQWTRIGE